MFKRIISLALMLALVLTVAPVTMLVSAAPDGYTQAGTSEVYYKLGTADDVAANTNGKLSYRKAPDDANRVLFIQGVDGDEDGDINIEGAAAALKTAAENAFVVIIEASITEIGDGWFDGSTVGAVIVEGAAGSSLAINAGSFKNMTRLREIIIARDNITWAELNTATTVDGLLNPADAAGKTGGINIFVADDDVAVSLQALDNTATLRKMPIENTNGSGILKPYATGIYDITTTVYWLNRTDSSNMQEQWIDWVFSDGTLYYDQNEEDGVKPVQYHGASTSTLRWNAHLNDIKKIVIGEGLKEFNGGGNWGYHDSKTLYPNLEEIVLPSTFTTIYLQDFLGATKLSKINLEDTKVTSIGEKAFARTAITRLELPSTVTTVGKSSLNTVTASSSLTLVVNSVYPGDTFNTGAFNGGNSTNTPVEIQYRDSAHKQSWIDAFASVEGVTVGSYIDPTLPTGYKYTDYFGKTEDIGATIPSSTKFITLLHRHEGWMTLVDAEGNVLDTVDAEDDVFFKFEFARCLTPNSSYKIKKGEDDLISFTTGDAVIAVKSNSERQMLWVNSFDESKPATVALISYTDETKEKAAGALETPTVTLTAGSFGEMPITGEYTDAVLIFESSTPVFDVTKIKATPFDENRKTVLSGKVSAGEEVVILIKNEAGIAVYARAVEANANGEYAATVDFSSLLTDTYTVVVYANGSAYKTTVVSSANASSALTALEGATSPTEVLNIISTLGEELEFAPGVAEGLSETEKAEVQEKAAEYLYKEIKDEPSLGKNETVEKYNQAMLMAALTTDNTDEVEAYINDTAVLETEEVVAKWFLNGGEEDGGTDSDARAAAWRSGVIDRMTGESFDSFEDFDDKFVEALVYEVIDNHASVAQMITCITGINSAVINNTEKDRKNVAYISKAYLTKLAQDGKSYSDFDDYDQFLKDLKSYESGMYYNGDGGNGGGGGGIYVPSAGYTDNSTLVVEPLPTSKFSDMAGFDWAEEAVTALADRGIINGKGDGMFDPSATVKREEFAKMIVELADLDDVADIIFDDVTENDWYYNYIKKAYAAGIINGISADKFGAGQNISRQDMAVIIYNVLKLKYPGLKSEKTEFVDAESIADYAAEAVGALTNEGILNGYEDASFRPEGSATRAEAAKVIYGILNYFK